VLRSWWRVRHRYVHRWGHCHRRLCAQISANFLFLYPHISLAFLKVCFSGSDEPPPVLNVHELVVNRAEAVHALWAAWDTILLHFLWRHPDEQGNGVNSHIIIFTTIS
jgi:hypothetical protein